MTESGNSISVDCSGRQWLKREQRKLKAPQERSDEEIEAARGKHLPVTEINGSSHDKLVQNLNENAGFYFHRLSLINWKK